MTLSLGLPNRNREVSFGEKGVSLTSEVLCQGWGGAPKRKQTKWGPLMVLCRGPSTRGASFVRVETLSALSSTL